MRGLQGRTLFFPIVVQGRGHKAGDDLSLDIAHLIPFSPLETQELSEAGHGPMRSQHSAEEEDSSWEILLAHPDIQPQRNMIGVGET